MPSATLSLQDTYQPAGLASRSAPSSHAAGGALAGVQPHTDGGWLRKHGAAGSLSLHGAALLALWALSSAAVKTPAAPPVVELIRLAPEPEMKIEPPKPEPVKEQQLAPAAAKPVAQPLPQPRTVAAAADQAETYTPPAPAQHAAPVVPVTPSAPTPVSPAPPAPPVTSAPKQISTEGIPTDYVNQVYARINSHADYPREARMRRQQGKVGYKLTLNPQGALLNIEILSSGVEALDEAAKEAIRRAAPYPKLPELGASTYLLAGSIVFKIN